MNFDQTHPHQCPCLVKDSNGCERLIIIEEGTVLKNSVIAFINGSDLIVITCR